MEIMIKMKKPVISMVTLSTSFLFTICLATFIPAAHAGDLIVVVENIKSDQGKVRAALFNNASDFPKTITTGQIIAAKAGTVSFTFKDVPSGRYAVSAIHDLNGNEKLDTNFVGKPNEPFGFSRDAHGTFAPPSFDDAAIQLDESAKTITISVK